MCREIKMLGRRSELKIGEKSPAFIIAEFSANHGQNFNRTVSLIKEAKENRSFVWPFYVLARVHEQLEKKLCHKNISD